MGVVYHANFFSYFESARAEPIRQLGFTYDEMGKMGVIMPLMEAHAKFLRPARYDDLLTSKVMIKELPEQHKIKFLHEVINEKKQLHVNGYVVLYFINTKMMKPALIPDELRTILTPYFN